jgi:uncharacterized protein (TIGR02217 family)
MAFLESRMSPRIERGAKGGPTNRGRRKVYSTSGKLNQVFEWSAPLSEFDISHGILLPDSTVDPHGLVEIESMWHVIHFTPYTGLRFRNWADYTAVKANTSLTNTSSNLWQLQRKYTFASITFKKDIYKPNSDVAIFTASDAPCTFTLDTATGIATVTSGTPSYWTGTFDYPVTFKDDDLMMRLDGTTANLLLVADPIILEEIRL